MNEATPFPLLRKGGFLIVKIVIISNNNNLFNHILPL